MVVEEARLCRHPSLLGSQIAQWRPIVLVADLAGVFCVFRLYHSNGRTHDWQAQVESVEHLLPLQTSDGV